MTRHRYMTVEQRFAAAIFPVPEAGCWIWMGCTDKDGYGTLQLSPGVRMGAHRYALALRLGRDVKPGLFACHKCDTPSCVNPSHLYEGDNLSNMADMIQRGRQSTGDNVRHRQRGEDHYDSRLTEQQVVEIRASKSSLGKLAAAYGVSKQTISKVRKGRTWKHITQGTKQ